MNDEEIESRAAALRGRMDALEGRIALVRKNAGLRLSQRQKSRLLGSLRQPPPLPDYQPPPLSA